MKMDVVSLVVGFVVGFWIGMIWKALAEKAKCV